MPNLAKDKIKRGDRFSFGKTGVDFLSQLLKKGYKKQNAL